jgi:transcriptional regulator with XRE-family HTH domain
MPRIRQYAEKYAMADLSAHIKGRMRNSGITQEDLGVQLRKSQQSISRLLNKPERMPIGTLRKICKFVDIDPETIMKAAWCEKN